MLALDGTVIRPPLSGVHYAVKNQIIALLRHCSPGQLVCFTLDAEIRAAAGRAQTGAPALPPGLRRVSRRILWQQTALPGRLRRLGCDRLFALAYTAPVKCPVPYALQVHDTIALRRPLLCNRLNALHMRTLMPGSIRRAETIITSSTRVADEVVRIGCVGQAKVHVVPLGVDDIFLADTPPPPLPDAIRELKPYILFVGNIEPKKDLGTLVAAFDKLAAYEVNLILAGRVGWRCRDVVDRIKAYKGRGTIKRLGYIDRRLLPALYGEAAAFVMPSVEEGFGLPVLEAMACQTPVVHSDHPVLGETANNLGVTFPAGDAEALAACLKEILRSPAGNNEAARAYAYSRTWDLWAATIGEITGWFQ